MALKARVDRHRCIGAGSCITIAPTVFDWHEGEFLKAGVLDASSVEDELVREAALACPTGALVVEEVEELLPWQLRGKQGPRRVEKTFMFTDIEGSTNLVEALGDEAWQGVLRWHDETLRSLFAEHKGEEVVGTRRRVLHRVRFARRGPRVRGRDPTASGRAPPGERVRPEGPDRRARLGCDPGRPELLWQGRARGGPDRGARSGRRDPVQSCHGGRREVPDLGASNGHAARHVRVGRDRDDRLELSTAGGRRGQRNCSAVPPRSGPKRASASYAAYLKVSPSVGWLKTIWMNTSTVPSSAITA